MIAVQLEATIEAAIVELTKGHTVGFKEAKRTEGLSNRTRRTSAVKHTRFCLSIRATNEDIEFDRLLEQFVLNPIMIVLARIKKNSGQTRV